MSPPFPPRKASRPASLHPQQQQGRRLRLLCMRCCLHLLQQRHMRNRRHLYRLRGAPFCLRVPSSCPSPPKRTGAPGRGLPPLRSSSSNSSSSNKTGKVRAMREFCRLSRGAPSSSKPPGVPSHRAASSSPRCTRKGRQTNMRNRRQHQQQQQQLLLLQREGYWRGPQRLCGCFNPPSCWAQLPPETGRCGPAAAAASRRMQAAAA